MITEKAVTYSLLAHIRNTGTLIKGPLEIFIPLVKRILHRLYSEGITKGRSISEIKDLFDKVYFIDIPIPVLRSVLLVIASEMNTDEIKNFQIFQDNAFLINNYFFEDFENSIHDSKDEVQRLQNLFLKFCEINNVEHSDATSIFDFIDKSKRSLSRYLSNRLLANNEDFTIEAKFIDYFKKVPRAYEWIQKIYLGSIISSFLEYKTENSISNVELLFDTNFIVSLIDLNTIESTHTCTKLMEIGKNQGYKFSVLRDTIEETQALLKKKAEYFSDSFLQSRVNPEDIYNACNRRNLAPSDLERIADNLEDSLNLLGINIVPSTEKYQNMARTSYEFETLKTIRKSTRAALHDATAIHYVKVKRDNRKVYEFEKVKCWFVHNSNQSETNREFTKEPNDYQPESIKVDELLNIIWLSNPSINRNLNQKDITEIGLSSLVAFTLNDSLPRASIIKELDDNIHRFAKEEISDKDILLISTRIVNRQLKDIQSINSLAETNKDEFVRRLKDEATKQDQEEVQKQERLNSLLTNLSASLAEINNKKEEFDKIRYSTTESNKQLEGELISLKDQINLEKEFNKKLLNEIKIKNQEEFYAKEIKKWRRSSIIEITICLTVVIIGLLFLFSASNWDFQTVMLAVKNLQSNAIIPLIILVLSLAIGAFLIPSILLKYRNYSNIEAFKKGLKLPNDLK